MLQSLASSILPLLVDPSLWSLPIQPSKTVEEKPLLSPRTLYANCCVSVLLLELITSFCEILGSNLDQYLSTILYPIMEKAGHGSPPMVQRAAHRSVEAISAICGFPNLPTFARDRFNSLMATMLSRLRLPGGAHFSGDTNMEDTLAVCRSVRWLLDTVIQEYPADSNKETTSSMVELLSLLVERFDYLFLEKVLSERDIYELTLVHKSSFNYFLTIFGAEDDAVYTYRLRGVRNESPRPWLDLLSAFRKASFEGFQSKAQEEQKLGENESGRVVVTIDRISSIRMAEIELVSILIKRNCYMLSNESLSVRISSCDGLISGFRFLAFVACFDEVSYRVAFRTVACWQFLTMHSYSAAGSRG